jgi:hypothetical protein
LVIDQVDWRYPEPPGVGDENVATDTIMSSPARAAMLADVVLNALEV